MKQYITVLILIISFSACTKRDNRKVVDDTEAISEAKKEHKTVDVADLPILIDSTHYVIHPIGHYRLERHRSDYSEYGSKRSNYGSNVNYSNDRISGDLSNVKFQKIDSNDLHSLTDATLKIKSMVFLRDIFENNKKGYFLYDVVDKDTNADSDFDAQDLESLYISHLNGTGFRKLSPDLQDVMKWKVILEANKLYFKSLEDTDGNGEFDIKDKTHYFYLDLGEDNSKVVEYFPV